MGLATYYGFERIKVDYETCEAPIGFNPIK